jgi:hypothetical protein
MRSIIKSSKLRVLVGVLLAATGWAATPNPSKIHTAEGKKTNSYVRDGVIQGGDKAINEITIQDIRRAPNKGFERIVIDLSGTRNGEPMAIERPPYFQVAVSPDEKRLIFTIWGKPKLQFNSKRVIAALKKSPLIQSVELLPKLEDDSWTFVIGLKEGKPVEVFELTNSVRIIADIRMAARGK